MVFVLNLKFLCPPPFLMGGGGHIASLLSICMYVCTYVRLYIHITNNGFRLISFENIGVLDSYFIHRYIIMKYRSSTIKDKIHQLLSELMPLILYEKWSSLIKDKLRLRIKSTDYYQSYGP